MNTTSQMNNKKLLIWALIKRVVGTKKISRGIIEAEQSVQEL